MDGEGQVEVEVMVDGWGDVCWGGLVGGEIEGLGRKGRGWGKGVEGGVGAAGWGGMEVGTGESEAGGGDVGNLFMRSTV